MVIVLETDNDLPQCLNTEPKRAAKARELAHAHTGIPVKDAHGPSLEGFFSRTIIVTLQNDEKLVIQFRPEPLGMQPFKLAREKLGAVVPDIGLIEDDALGKDGIWVYWMTYVPGEIWLFGVAGKDPRTLITINRGLGRILAKGCVGGDSVAKVEKEIRPHLELLLASENESISRFRDVTKDLLGKLDLLKPLPLFVSHYDLNAANVLIDDDCEVSGLVDWEFSTPLPFGMGLGRIHTLAGEYSEQKFRMSDEFEEAERALWQETYDGVPADVQKLFHTNSQAIQTAVLVGTLLDAFQLENGKLGGINPVVVKALPMQLTYRIPILRGSDPPYSV